MKSVAFSALMAAFLASPAMAQYGSPPAASKSAPQSSPQPAAKVTVSKGAFKPMSELEAAINAKDLAAIPGKLAAAEAAAKTKDDKYMVALLRVRAAAAANDPAALELALPELLATGRMPEGFETQMYTDIGRLYFSRKQYDQAAAAFERVLASQPGNVQVMLLLAETRNSQGKAADAVAILQKAIAATRAAGQQVDENWYKRMVAIAYGAKLPSTVTLARDWVALYPTPGNWRDALLLYRQSKTLDDQARLDLYRLSRATKSLASERDYYDYAATALLRGYPGEAKAVLEDGFAAKAIDRNKAEFATAYTAASTRSAGDRASIDASAKTALAGSAARPAVAAADAYYGYGDYAKAAELYRAALTKTGADANQLNLRLGAALAMAGDKAGATAAFNAVSGPNAELAKFWLVFLAAKA